MTATRRQFSAFLAAFLAMALYAVSLGGGYVYDDVPVVRNDPRMHEPIRWKLLWTQSYNGGVDRLYRPLVSTSYALQWWLHGDKAWTFHLINILLHAAMSACVAELARRLFGSRTGIIAGMLFAAHPIHVEAVANIVGRAELLCSLGMFAAMILALKPITPRRAAAIGGCFLIAVLSKEQGIFLPLILLVLLLLRRRQSPDTPIGTRNGLLTLTSLLLWILAGYLVWREQMFKFWWDRSALEWTVNPLIRSTGIDRWLVPIEILGRYTALLIAPFKLSPDYSANVIESFVHLREPYFYIGILSLVVWCALLCIAIAKRHGFMLFLLLSLGLTYGLVGNMIILIGTSMGERLMYIPSAFFIILVSAGLSKAPLRAIPVVMALLLALASLRTVTYTARWSDSIRLFEAAVRDQPHSIRLYLLLADEYLRARQYDKAAAVNAAGREVGSDYWDIWRQAGQIATEQGDFDNAQRYLDKSGQLDPNLYTAAWMTELARRRAATQPAVNPPP